MKDTCRDCQHRIRHEMEIEGPEAEHGQILHWRLTRPKVSGTTDLDIAAEPATHAQFPGPTAMCIVAGKRRRAESKAQRQTCRQRAEGFWSHEARTCLALGRRTWSQLLISLVASLSLEPLAMQTWMGIHL